MFIFTTLLYLFSKAPSINLPQKYLQRIGKLNERHLVRRSTSYGYGHLSLTNEQFMHYLHRWRYLQYCCTTSKWITNYFLSFLILVGYSLIILYNFIFLENKTRKLQLETHFNRVRITRIYKNN